MTRFLKGLALLVAVACFTWVGVLWHWQATQRDMSVEDIGLYVVALPLTLFVLLLLGRWALADATAKARQRESGAAAAGSSPGQVPSAQANSDGEAERRASMQLLAAHLNCRAGASPAAVVAAVREGQPRPDLDAELRDEDGLPLMTARIDGLEVDTVELPELDEPRSELVRALAALTQPLEQALAALQHWHRQFAADAPEPPMLRVLASWPHDWNDEERKAAQGWLLGRIAASETVPAECVAVVVPPLKSALWSEAERLLRWLERERSQDIILVVACHSAIGSDSVRRLGEAGRLFTPHRPMQPIAGEAAAALLIAPATSPRSPDADAPRVHLHGASVRLREQPIESPGRSDAQLAKACIEEAVASAGLAADAIGAAVHDADQHTPRAAEALTALMQAQPHLQPADDVLQTGALNGQVAVVAPLITIALAAYQAVELNKPCLALSVDDSQQRLALVARVVEIPT